MDKNIKHPHQVHVNRQGLVRERNASGLRPTGPILGQVKKDGRGDWYAISDEGKHIAVCDTRRSAVQAIINLHTDRAKHP